MAMFTFGKRPVVKQRPSVQPYQSTDLSGRMNSAAESGSGIVPGANKQAADPSYYKLGNPMEQIGGALKKLFGGKKK